jgi:aspartyl-tRNA synthetase
MISGFDRYFQIARCFRDEDLRADRQLEFTQVDLEMSFPRRESVFGVVEQFMKAAFAAAGVDLPIPFPRISYDESMRQYGTDKPDLRLPGLTDVRPAFTEEALATLQIDPALPVVALRIPKVGELSRKEREDNHPLFDQKKGAKFIDDFKRLAKSFPESAAKVRELAGAADEDFVIIVAGDPAHHIKASDTKFPDAFGARDQRVRGCGQLPRRAGEEVCGASMERSASPMKLSRTRAHGAAPSSSTAAQPSIPCGSPISRCLSTIWPRANGCPRTIPSPRPTTPTWPTLSAIRPAVRADCYDLAMNGLELGSGSIRIHRKDVQQADFPIAGHQRRRSAGSASDSSSTRSSTARRRMAALRWAWIAS